MEKYLNVQCGQRYYASTFFQDFQNVFHYINPGVLWKVSSVVVLYQKWEFKEEKTKNWVINGIMQMLVSAI